MTQVLEEVRASYLRAGRPERVLLGLSGGADSVALFRLLLLLKDQEGFSLSCVHVNHGLREEAQQEEAFVRTLCAAHDVPLSIAHVGIPTGNNLEERARVARHGSLRDAARIFSAQAIALAHHQDDQAETVMLRLLHGTGTQGLSAMREWSNGLWRPLLSVRRSVLERMLTACAQPWVTDASNLDRRFTRNHIRAELMPVMEHINPAAVCNLARTAAILAQEDDYWSAFAADWLKKHASLHPACCYMLAQPFASLHVAAQRQVLRRFVLGFLDRIDFRQLEALRALALSSCAGVVNLPEGIKASRTQARLHLTGISEQRLPLGTLSEKAVHSPRKSTRETFDVDKLSAMVVRYRTSGDRIHPLGAKGSKLLSDYLRDRSVDQPFRDHWPICCVGQRVLWVPGIGMAQDAAVTPQTKRRVHLHYVGRLPDEYIGWEGENGDET